MYIFYDNDNENENEKQLTETAETNVEKVDAERKPTQVSAKQADECKVSSVQPIHGSLRGAYRRYHFRQSQLGDTYFATFV